jgi:hypothetical protein
MIWALFALIALGIVASFRLTGLARWVMWTVIALVGSVPFRGGRVLVLPFLFVLILEVIYWLALPPADDGGAGLDGGAAES